jgi:hypothetical protein
MKEGRREEERGESEKIYRYTGTQTMHNMHNMHKQKSIETEPALRSLQTIREDHAGLLFYRQHTYRYYCTSYSQ